MNVLEMDKGFEPKKVEARWQRAWEESKYHVADVESNARPFTMVIPPPNVTGELHMGHALDMTVQDIVARWKRMTGHDVLWLPGTDHAGIGTQHVVEKALAENGVDRRDLGRAEFERRIWEWRDEYGGRILEQIRRMGFSVDWSRLRFTLDEGLSRAVRRVFVSLYRDGLIYRDEYLVNWCPGCNTAISDLEVKHVETEGSLWRIRYSLDCEHDGEAEQIEVEVETTRPETMLGDTALAVHPGDGRYSNLIGRTAILPVVGRRLPIIADEFVDPEFGTGVVKVTPAHDLNDYDAGKRHDLECVRVIAPDGTMTREAGEFAGMERFQAREAVLGHLESAGVLVATRAHSSAVGHCDRCDTVVEPQLSTQWFVRMKPLAEPALEAVESGSIVFHPANQVRVYREWMTNIRDWCVSRQLWWGHRIPAWYCDTCSETVVSEESPGNCRVCDGSLRQDPDVLDTWFSSGLWPFSTLGWPEETRDLARYYPTDLLVTGYDILFFWVARMIMQGLRFQDDVPFRSVYLHGLIRDENGFKMSKSRGNGVDPLELVDEFGSDALRFTLASMTTPGTDMLFSRERLAGYRSFCNKLWNGARFALMNLGEATERDQAALDAADPMPNTVADRWILSRAMAMVSGVEESLERYRFDDACDVIYQFTWHEFCDWYIEMAKGSLSGNDADAQRSTRGCLVAVLEIVLRTLQPIMPHITEEIWSRLPGERKLLALSSWATVQPAWKDSEAERDVQFLQGIVTEVRRLRAEAGVNPRQRAPLVLEAAPARQLELEGLVPYIGQLVHADRVDLVGAFDTPEGTIAGVHGDVQVFLALEGVVDREREGVRISRALEKVSGELQRIEKRLENLGFLANAPTDVVEKVRSRQQELSAEGTRLQGLLDRLQG